VNTVMFPTAVVMCAAVRETHKADRSLLENEGRIVLGPSRVFRPTPGLCALFAKTGTRCSKTLSKTPSTTTMKPPHSTRTFADVVREG
jgi:hypothetical protein